MIHNRIKKQRDLQKQNDRGYRNDKHKKIMQFLHLYRFTYQLLYSNELKKNDPVEIKFFWLIE